MVDLDRWRTQGVAKKCETWLEQLSGLDTDTIQLPMNLVFHGLYDHLDWRWNVDLTQHTFGARLRQDWVTITAFKSHECFIKTLLLPAWDVSRNCPYVHPGLPSAPP
mmetsp:Transcript_131936/g.422136  ORF Transcript_131936/g.422136 Transcript_131936/m.422136 type:complete len:107 (-) Transcript_131936:128-448(-)